MQLSAQTGAFIASAAAEANFKVSMTWRSGAAEREGNAMQKLLDFDVAIEPLNDGYYTRMVASPAGEAYADFALPFTDKNLKILILRVIGSVGRVRRKAGESSQRKGGCWRTSGVSYSRLCSPDLSAVPGPQPAAADSRDTGLRIRLRLAPALADIPWEYLYGP